MSNLSLAILQTDNISFYEKVKTGTVQNIDLFSLLTFYLIRFYTLKYLLNTYLNIYNNIQRDEIVPLLQKIK